MSELKPIKVAINALGGQGGGVLSSWLIALGEASGYIVQSTSVPGVAQRTGATIYYVELFPKALVPENGKPPILALMPVPGDVDIVLASEIMEAGRAIDRGFVTDKTTLIASSHRVYAIGEKIGMGDARISPESIHAAAKKVAGRFLVADLDTCVQQTGSIISSVLFGALAGSGAMPMDRAAFESVITEQGRAVKMNLAGFGAGYEAIQVQSPKASPATSAKTTEAASAVQYLLERLQSDFPLGAHEMIFEGLKKVVDHQDRRYGELYLNRLEKLVAHEPVGSTAAELTCAAAKHLALWMAYDDTIRVADLKTRSTRFSRFRKDVVAAPGQIVHVSEYMHPRIEEFCDLLPPKLATWVLRSKAARKVLSVFFGKGRRLPTTKLRGFIPLYLLSSLKPLRRTTFKYHEENARIEAWFASVLSAAGIDYSLAVELAKLQKLIKGYGDTHARGLNSFERIVERLDDIKHQPDPSATLRLLRAAALADEEGQALSAALDQLTASLAA